MCLIYGIILNVLLLLLFMRLRFLEKDWAAYCQQVGNDIGDLQKAVNLQTGTVAKLRATADDLIQFQGDLDSRITAIEQQLENGE